MEASSVFNSRRFQHPRFNINIYEIIIGIVYYSQHHNDNKFQQLLAELVPSSGSGGRRSAAAHSRFPRIYRLSHGSLLMANRLVATGGELLHTWKTVSASYDTGGGRMFWTNARASSLWMMVPLGQSYPPNSGLSFLTSGFAGLNFFAINGSRSYFECCGRQILTQAGKNIQPVR